MSEASAIVTPYYPEAARNPGWRVALAAFFGTMVGFGSLLVFTFSVFLKPLTGSFGWSRESVSGAFGVAALCVAVCSPGLGHLLDRDGPRRVILPCMAVFGCAFASLGLLTPSIFHLYAVFAVLGIVGNGTTQMGYSRAVSTWFDSRRGLALATVMAGVGTGAMTLPVLAQRLINGYGWRSAYFALGGLVLALGIPLTAVFVRERPHAGPHSEAPPRGTTVGACLRGRTFWILAAALFLSSVSINGAIAHASALLTDRGVGLQTAALALSALGLASFAGRLLTGALLDRFFGPRVGCCLLGASACGILLLARAATGAQGVAAAALIGIGVGAEADFTPYVLTRYFGLRSFSTLYGFTWTVYAVAGAIGPALMGKAFDATGSYASLLLALAGATAIAALLLNLLPRYPKD
ncbi:MAG: MFS transporter [Acidobacteriia bacterium]|nr:MFS transporter [Terriglobia bacterium]